jgi:ankyrin repeat protein
MFFSELPDELKIAIFNHCDIHTLTTCTSVCKDWQRLANDDAIWHKQFNKLADISYEKTKDNTLSWKSLYHLHHQKLNQLADKLFKILSANKHSALTSAYYAKKMMKAISGLVNQAISTRALFHFLLKRHPQILVCFDNKCNHALHWFAACGFTDAVEMILVAGQIKQTLTGRLLMHPLINLRNKEGHTPLHFALYTLPEHKHEHLLEIIRLGLAHGADLTITDGINGANFLEDLQRQREDMLIPDSEYQAIMELIQQPSNARLLNKFMV